jgi:hypothetical protein
VVEAAVTGAGDKDALATAWRIHDAQVQWTGQVDTKASFVLAIETAVAAGVVTLSTDGRSLTSLDPWWAEVLYWIGVAALAIALVAGVLVVRPRLRNPHLEAESKGNFIYFGHARFWNSSELQTALAGDPLEMVAKQIVEMAKIAWRKHVLLSVSVTSALLAALFIALAAWAS